jgi:hypothetical protein
MRQSFLRLSIIMSLLLSTVFFVSLAQDDVTITVSPTTGVIGATILDISAGGLVADNSYILEIIYNRRVIFSRDTVADADGNVELTASSTYDDEPGIYTVQLVGDDERILAVTEFEFITSETESYESSVDTIGDINISPRSGSINTLHTITILNLDTDTSYTVEISPLETEDVTYSRAWTTDNNGKITIEIFAEEGDPPGEQVVTVFEDSGDIVAQAGFIINEPPLRAPVVDVIPSIADAGREFTITVSGLASFDSVTAQITSQGNVLVDTLQARASSDGVAQLSFWSPDDLGNDTYDVRIFVEGNRMVETSLTIGDAETVEESNADAGTSDVTITVDPEVGAIGTNHVMAVIGLEPEQPFTLAIMAETGEIEYTATRTADADGEFSFNISSSEGDESGVYPVRIADATTGKTLATAQMIIEGGNISDESTQTDTTAQVGSPSITITPDTGELGTTYMITLSGMPADTRIGVVIRAVSDDRLALSSVVPIDANGNVTLEFTAHELDIPDDYTVNVGRPSGNRVSGTFTIEGAIASVDPQTGVAGTSYRITVDDLDPNETAPVDVTFDGESVYTTEITADADGSASLNLTTDESDSLGDYTVTIMRESGNQPTLVFTLMEEEEAEEDEPADSTDDDDSSDEHASTNVQVIEGRLTQDNESIEFEGEEGQYVIISVESDDFDTLATVYDEDYYEIAYNDDSLGELNSRIGPLLLPYSGNYTLEVSQSYYVEDDISEGEFVVTIEFVSVASIEYDESTPFELNSETSALYYELPVESGDSLNIVVDSDGSIDTVLQILSYDGYEFASDDDSGAGFDAEFNNLIFDTSGDYVLVLSSFSQDEAGEGVLMVSRNSVKSLDEGAVTITLNDKVYQDLLVFEGEEDQVITLNLERISGDAEDLYVYASVDGIQIMSYNTMGVPDNLPLTFVMPMDGQVVVTFEEYSYQGGISFNITIEKD